MNRRTSAPHVGPQVATATGGRSLPAALCGELTRFQVSIVRLVADGMTDRQIARELGTTPRTIETEVVRARARLDAANRAHLAAIAVRRRLI